MDRYVLEPKGPAHGSILKVSIPFCEVALCAHQAMSMVCKQNINEGSAKEKQRNFHLQAWQLDKKKSLFRGSNTAFFETNVYRGSSHSVDF